MSVILDWGVEDRQLGVGLGDLGYGVFTGDDLLPTEESEVQSFDIFILNNLWQFAQERRIQSGAESQKSKGFPLLCSALNTNAVLKFLKSDHVEVLTALVVRLHNLLELLPLLQHWNLQLSVRGVAYPRWKHDLVFFEASLCVLVGVFLVVEMPLLWLFLVLDEQVEVAFKGKQLVFEAFLGVFLLLPLKVEEVIHGVNVAEVVSSDHLVHHYGRSQGRRLQVGLEDVRSGAVLFGPDAHGGSPTERILVIAQEHFVLESLFAVGLVVALGQGVLALGLLLVFEVVEGFVDIELGVVLGLGLHFLLGRPSYKL
jgi:hypothetical protein